MHEKHLGALAVLGCVALADALLADYNRAIEAYKYVITQYPGREEARLAMRDLKSIYVEANRVDEFAALAAQMPEMCIRDRGKDRTPEEEAKVKDRGFRYYFEMRGVTSRVQVQALDYLVYGCLLYTSYLKISPVAPLGGSIESSTPSGRLNSCIRFEAYC